MFASAGATDSMKTPESVRYDADLDAFFVSNINGNPSQKDGNGFIDRIDAGNTQMSTHLVEGGKNGVTLNAPKGMAIVGDTLWVADIDAVRAFNKRTGAPIATGMTHPGHDQIFKIAGRKASFAIASDSSLKGPNGIAWDAANGRFALTVQRRCRERERMEGWRLDGHRHRHGPWWVRWRRSAERRTHPRHELGRLVGTGDRERHVPQSHRKRRGAGRHRYRHQAERRRTAALQRRSRGVLHDLEVTDVE